MGGNDLTTLVVFRFWLLAAAAAAAAVITGRSSRKQAGGEAPRVVSHSGWLEGLCPLQGSHDKDAHRPNHSEAVF